MKNYFSKFREGIIGVDQEICTPNHEDIKLIYADWTASGRMYQPIEDKMQKDFLPFVANTHTDTNYTGSKMTYAYHRAKKIIKNHVGANKDDILISSNSGMTGIINKFQRILGLKIHESFKNYIDIEQDDKIESVLVSIKDIKTLTKAYSNYFFDISEFESILKKHI